MKTTYIVSGYMRTGTSMMMAALEAGGLEAVRSDDRDKMNQRFGDKDYLPNENGFYEIPFREVTALGFPSQYKGKLLKVMSMYIHMLVPMHYRVVFMLRDKEEIRQSFEAAFSQQIKIEQYNEAMEQIISLLRNRKDMDLTVLHYRDVIENPKQAFEVLQDRGWPIDVEAAVKTVDPKLYRFRKEALTPGI